MAEIGSILRETRMRARIDISQVEQDTKIRAKYLRAIENEEWTLLPGNVFTRSFLRTYAEYLHIDPRPLLDEFQRRTEFRIEAQRQHSRSRRRSRRKSGRPTQRQRAQIPRVLSPPVMIVTVLVVVVAALAAIGLLFNGKHHAKSNGSGGTVVSTPTTTAGLHTNTTTHHPRTTTTPAVSSLKLVATGTVYVCVTSPTGKQLIAKTFSAGESSETVHAKEFLVTLGNAYAQLYLNGRLQTLNTTSTPIRLRISQGKLAPVATGASCS